jgi:hypothetical protein
MLSYFFRNTAQGGSPDRKTKGLDDSQVRTLNCDWSRYSVEDGGTSGLCVSRVASKWGRRAGRNRAHWLRYFRQLDADCSACYETRHRRCDALPAHAIGLGLRRQRAPVRAEGPVYRSSPSPSSADQPRMKSWVLLDPTPPEVSFSPDFDFFRAMRRHCGKALLSVFAMGWLPVEQGDGRY